MAVRSITGQSSSVTLYNTSKVSGVSSSTTTAAAKTSSTTTRNVAKTTVRTTSSTTQKKNSNATSTVKYSSSKGISSSTTVASKSVSSSTTSKSISSSTTSKSISSSTTSKLISSSTTSKSISSSTTSKSISSSTTSKSISSSTTIAGKTSSTTASDMYSSSTPTGVKNVTIQMYSSATPQGKEVVVQTQEKGVVDTRVNDAKEMIVDRLKEFVDDKVQLGISYNLVEIPVFLNCGFAKFAADIEFHECDDDTIASICAEIDPSVKELEEMFQQEISMEFFEGCSLSLGKENFSVCFEKDDVSIEIDLAEIKNRKLAMSVSKSVEIGEQATLNFSLEVEMIIPERNGSNDDEGNGILNGIRDFAEEQIVRIGETNNAVIEWGKEQVVRIGETNNATFEWTRENALPILATTIVAIGMFTLGGPTTLAAGASVATATAVASATTFIYNLFADKPEEIKPDEIESDEENVEVR